MVKHDPKFRMAFEHAAVYQQRRRQSRIVQIAYQVAQKITREGAARRSFERMDAYRHPERFRRCPENLEIRVVQLSFEDLGRDFDPAQSMLRGAFQLRGGDLRSLHRHRCEWHEML